MDKSEVKEDDWKEYIITKDKDQKPTGITVDGVNLKDLNNDGVVDAIDLAKHLKEKGTLSDDDKSKNKLFRKNESLLDESLPGYANANYNGLVRASCDFTNTRIGLMVRSITGWGFSNIRITRVEGVVKV